MDSGPALEKEEKRSSPRQRANKLCPSKSSAKLEPGTPDKCYEWAVSITTGLRTNEEIRWFRCLVRVVRYTFIMLPSPHHDLGPRWPSFHEVCVNKVDRQVFLAQVWAFVHHAAPTHADASPPEYSVALRCSQACLGIDNSDAATRALPVSSDTINPFHAMLKTLGLPEKQSTVCG